MKKLLLFLALCLLPVAASAQMLSAVVWGGSNPTAATPTFSPVAGAVSNPTTVTASTATSDGCTMYFDTSNPPTTAQTTYSVTTGVTLYAQARGCAHHGNSVVGSAAYTISAGSGYVSGSGVNGHNYCNSGTCTATAAATIQSGSDFLIAVVTFENSGSGATCTLTSVTSPHVTWTSRSTATGGYEAIAIAIYTGVISGGYTGSETITDTFTTSGTTCDSSIASTEWIPATGGTGAFDKAASANGPNVQPVPSGTTATTSYANEVLVGAMFNISYVASSVAPFTTSYTWIDRLGAIGIISSEVVSTPYAYSTTWTVTYLYYEGAGIVTVH